MYRPDSYAKEAKKCGYRSRAAWKLLEIDNKYHITKNVQSAMDLGCAPGSWLQVLRQRIRGNVVGVDILHTAAVPGTTIIQGDICSPEILEQLRRYHPQLIVSDMAPNTTGAGDLDHQGSMQLSYIALELACEILSPDGSFLCKIFGGSYEAQFFNDVKAQFTKTCRVKPAASKSCSKEIYILGLKRKT